MADYDDDNSRDDDDRRRDPTKPMDDRDDKDDGPGEPPDGVEPEFHQKVVKCMRQADADFDKKVEKHMKANAQKYGLSMSAGDGDGADEPAKNRRTPRDTDTVLKFRRMEEEMLAMKRQVARDRAEANLARRKEAARKAIDDFGLATTVEEVMKFSRDQPDEVFNNTLDYLIRTCKRDPAHGPTVRIAGQSPVEGGTPRGGDDPEKFSQEDLERAETYMRQHPGCDWEEAEKYAMESRPKRYTPTR